MDTNGINSNNNLSHTRYTFWLDDVSIFWRDRGYMGFVPNALMTRVEQLNAITLFCIYVLGLLLVCGQSAPSIYLPIVGIVMCVAMYYVFRADQQGIRDDLLRVKHKTSRRRNPLPVDMAEDSYEIESGYYDSGGRLHCGKAIDPIDQTDPTNPTNPTSPTNHIEPMYNLDESRLYQASRCRAPTPANPYMNPSTDDLNQDNVPVACNSDDPAIDTMVRGSFNADMYRDIEDVFDRKNSQRQFYTVAPQIPNDQEAFARWCYKFAPTCKTNQDHCARYQEYRTKYA